MKSRGNIKLQSNKVSNNSPDFSKLPENVDVKVFSKHFPEIKKLSDTSLEKSNRKKIRQTIILKIVNELAEFVEIPNYKALEIVMGLHTPVRILVENIRIPLTGISTIMEGYVDANITFTAWQSIVEGRKTMRAGAKDKTGAIDAAATVFKAVQKEQSDLDQKTFEGLSMESKIDGLQADSLPKETVVQLMAHQNDDNVLSTETKKALNKFKAKEISKYLINPGNYSLPSAK